MDLMTFMLFWATALMVVGFLGALGGLALTWVLRQCMY